MPDLPTMGRWRIAGLLIVAASVYTAFAQATGPYNMAGRLAFSLLLLGIVVVRT